MIKMQKNKKTVTFAITILLMILCIPLANVNADVINPEFILPRDVYKYGGDFRMYRDTDYTTLNPFSGTGATWQITILTYEGLVMVDPEWGVAPWLAASWDISPDGLTYTFYLQPHATWADGLPVTAEDVKYTFDQWVEQQLPRMLPYVKNIESVTVIDEKTVAIKLIDKDVTFLSRHLSWPSLMIVPKHIWENIEDWNTFVNDDPETHYGSGPFVLKEWKKGEYCQVEANLNYWMGRPYVDTITRIVISMRDMALLAFEKGELSTFSGLQGNEVPRFLDPEKYKIYTVEDSGQPNWYPNTRQRPGNDTQFRHAMWYMIDRETIIEAAHYGYGKIPTHMLSTPYETGGWIPPETVTEPQNLTKAAEILDAAGYLDVDDDGWRDYTNGDKMELKFVVYDFERFIKSAEILMDDMQSIGIDVYLSVIPSSMWSEVHLTTFNFDFAYFRYGPGGGDPLEPMSWSTSWGDNWIGFYNETFDNVYLEASTLLDPEERKPLVWELQRIMAENYAYIPHICNIGLNVLNTEVWDPLPNSQPWGPWSNLQSWHYYNVHLKGEPGAALANLVFEAPSEAIQKEPVVIKSTITDEEGNPLEGLYIDFRVEGFTVGSQASSSNGVSEFTWVPVEDGDFEIYAAFPGTSEYQSLTTDPMTITVGSAEPEPVECPAGSVWDPVQEKCVLEEEPTPPKDNTMLYLGVAAVIIIAVAAYYFMKSK